MIKHAVRRHFEGVEDDLLVTNYFDKLIQVPIRVPPLGTQEVRAYMMLLFVENSDTGRRRQREDSRRSVRATAPNVAGQAGRPGLRAIAARRISCRTGRQVRYGGSAGASDDDRLRNFGNPRLIKRFLNALSIRMTISNAQGVGVDEAVLAKLLLFERLGNPKAYAAADRRSKRQ